MTEADYYSMITRWQTGTDMINNQNCFAVNFGYNGEIPIPSFSLTTDIKQNLKQFEFEKTYKCFFVFVGGKYVEEMKTIVDIVEDISEQFHGIKPIAMFVWGKFSSWKINNFSSYGQDLTKVKLN